MVANQTAADRESDAQNRLINKIQKKFQPRIKKELIRANLAGLKAFEEFGSVPNSVIQPHNKRMTEILEDLVRNAVVASSIRQAELLKPQIKSLVQKQKLDEDLQQEQIDNRIEEDSSRFILAFAAASAAEISKTTGKVLLQKLDFAEIDEVLDQIDESSTNRSTTIADTTSHAGVVNGTLITTGAIATALAFRAQKTWITQRDVNVRQSHRLADGQNREIDASFLVENEALAFPGDPSGSPGNVINCRCVLDYILI